MTFCKQFAAYSSDLTCGWRITCSEGVSNEAGVTCALGPVTLDPAGGSDPTHPGARVHTLVADTGKSLGTVGVDGTLGLALDVGIALEARVAGARGRLVSVRALGIDATRTGSAGINDLRSRGGGGWSVAAGERVPDVSLVTDAQRHVAPDPAVGIDATEAWTGVLTLSVDAGLVLGTL